MAMVEFKNVDIIFGKNSQAALNALDQGKNREQIREETGCVLGTANANIKVEEGEICVLMGLSGSGKSTLLRAVNGLNKVVRGSVLLEDGGTQVDLASCDEQTLRRMRMERVSMVFQQFALLPWRTVEENVGFGLEIKGMSKEERTPIVEEKLKLVGLYEWKDKYAHELSGGMQQRVGLARAFSTDADILLMDEPFSALDPLIRDHLQDELLELQRNLKKTIIFVSHDLDEALKIGSHIAIMEGGHIVQYGEPEEIVLNPANEYVAEFVAHMNPLNVLRCASLMTTQDKLKRDDAGKVLLDRFNAFKVVADEKGVLREATYEDKMPLKIVAFDGETTFDASEGDVIIAAPTSITMKQAIELRESTGNPVLMVEDGHFVGVVGDDEIYQGILRQSNVTA
ncbi:choline ABC transporter ATP-binding protein [Kiloniella sp. b19]|uniref:choline ABC transporter ATP-binding protein n=1 Tax=Kiloniella sp. GXU_MW_B19 TaxID=3141326 RepID=UPI0031DFEA1D